MHQEYQVALMTIFCMCIDVPNLKIWHVYKFLRHPKVENWINCAELLMLSTALRALYRIRKEDFLRDFYWPQVKWWEKELLTTTMHRSQNLRDGMKKVCDFKWSETGVLGKFIFYYRARNVYKQTMIASN